MIPARPTPEEVVVAAGIITESLDRWGVWPTDVEWYVKSWFNMPSKPRSPTAGTVYALVARAEFTPTRTL